MGVEAEDNKCKVVSKDGNVFDAGEVEREDLFKSRTENVVWCSVVTGGFV